MSEREKEQEQESAFRVTDRRQFTAEGEQRPRESEQSATSSTAQRSAPSEGGTEKKQDAGTSSARPSAQPKKGPDPAPPIDFSSFILSLATTAMVHLGEMRDPATRERQKNLAAAKQMVDLLDMLKKKTEGNRTAEENRLLDDILYELRMKILSENKVIQF